MPKRIHKVILDSNKSTPIFEINKLDSLHLEVKITEVENIENAGVELFFKKSDGTLVSEVISQKEENIIKIDVKNGALDVPGIVIVQAKITEEDGNISSYSFKFNIRNSITSDDAIVNEVGIGAIEELKKKIDDAQIDPEVLKTKIEETINSGDLDVASKEEIEKVNSQLEDIANNLSNEINIEQFPKFEIEIGDSPRIERAIEYIKNNAEVNTIKFSSKKYILNSTISVPSGIKIRGEGRMAINTNKGTEIQRNGDFIGFDCDGSTSDNASPYTNIELYDITFTNPIGSEFTSPNVRFNKCHYFLISDCLFRGGKSTHLEILNCFDSRLRNTDFQGGGNITNQLPAVKMSDEISNILASNQIIFDSCRFEDYIYTGLYIGNNNNEIWLSKCKFESLSLTEESNHIKFNQVGTVKLDIQICGRQYETFVELNSVNNVNGVISFEHTNIDSGAIFNKPIIKTNNCNGIFLDLLGNLSEYYSLKYLVETIGSNYNFVLKSNITNILMTSETVQGAYFTGAVNSIGSSNYLGFISRHSNNLDDYWRAGNLLEEGDSYQWRIEHKKSDGTVVIPYQITHDGQIYFNKNVHMNGSLIPLTTSNQPWGTDGVSYVDTKNDLARVCTAINGSWIRVSKSNSYPISGTWGVGDIVLNISPVAGGYIGWICIEKGNPGIWKGYGLIEA